MREEEGTEIVRKIVSEWSKVYISQVFFANKFSNIYKYHSLSLTVVTRWSSASQHLPSQSPRGQLRCSSQSSRRPTGSTSLNSILKMNRLSIQSTTQ